MAAPRVPRPGSCVSTPTFCGMTILAKIRLYGVALALRTAEIQIADQRELGEGGGVPGRKRVAVDELAACGKGLVIQD